MSWRCCLMHLGHDNALFGRHGMGLQEYMCRHLRKWIPGTAGGTVRRQVRTVYFATSSGFAGGASSPVALQGKAIGHMCCITCHLIVQRTLDITQVCRRLS
jgi:hypothetical protein